MIKRNLEAFVYLSACLGMVLLSIILEVSDEKVYLSIFNIQLGNVYQCPIHYYFHIPCPTCGLSRAFILFADLNFSAAFKHNAGVFLLYPYVFMQIPLQLISISRHEKGLSNKKINQLNISALIAIGVLLIIVWLLKMFHILPVL